jgi:hypothetical protein
MKMTPVSSKGEPGDCGATAAREDVGRCPHIAVTGTIHVLILASPEDTGVIMIQEL